MVRAAFQDGFEELNIFRLVAEWPMAKAQMSAEESRAHSCSYKVLTEDPVRINSLKFHGCVVCKIAGAVSVRD
jgi:hypothetical protein